MVVKSKRKKYVYNGVHVRDVLIIIIISKKSLRKINIFG